MVLLVCIYCSTISAGKNALLQGHLLEFKASSFLDQENRMHKVTIWINLWLLEKVSVNGVRTHAFYNQRITGFKVVVVLQCRTGV